MLLVVHCWLLALLGHLVIVACILSVDCWWLLALLIIVVIDCRSLIVCCWLLLSLLFGVGSSFAWLIVVGCCYCCWVLAVLWLRIVFVD